jgi:glycosyltransferase involved in cell wall biosynthesis
MAAYLQSLAAPSVRVGVIPNGANPTRFAPRVDKGAHVRQRYGLSDAFIVGWSGILREWHRVDLILEALAAVPDAILRVVGDGPDRSRLERRSVEVGVRERFVVTGRVPHAEVPGYVSAFDVAVAAHDGTGYASPMKLLEYMGMALPVLAPRIPNIEDFISDGVNGRLFASGDARSLAEALRELRASADVRRALGMAARASIEHERNWMANANRVLTELEARTAPFTAAVSIAKTGAP